MTQTRYSTGGVQTISAADLYRSMSTATLQDLLWARAIERTTILDDLAELAKHDARSRLITQELAERGVGDEPEGATP